MTSHFEFQNKIWNFDKFQDKTALISEDGHSLSYFDLITENKKLLQNISGRSLIFCICENSIGSILGYTAFINGGAIPALLSSDIDTNLLKKLLTAYNPKYLWVPETMAKEFCDAKHIYSTFGYSLLKTNYISEYTLNDDLALLLTTSGSTGSPKFVRQSYKNILHNTQSIIEYLNIYTNERAITTLPMNYTYGLSIINTHLASGAIILVTKSTLAQKSFWDFFLKEGATSFGGVPFTYEILEKLRFREKDYPSLRYFTQAGGKLLPELHKKFAEYAIENEIKFFVMYGQCEATARMGYLPSEKALEKCGAMGVVIPGGKFTLINENCEIIESPGVTGELIYEGENVAMGYAESYYDLCLGDVCNGKLNTGDMAQFDSDGFFYIVGRKKRFLKIYGNRVNLDEMDMLIKSAFESLDCVCAGIDDKMYIFVDKPDLENKVRDFITSKTKLNPIAFKVIFVEKIPKNESGKTLYSELSRYYNN